jgi:acyl-homoserine-lactone acylase
MRTQESSLRIRSLAFSGLSLCLALGLASCSDSSPARYEVEVIRTAYGVPHIIADDWGSAGYGLGYAYAQDNFCVVMREIVASNGESARYFLPGEGANLKQDFIWRYYNADDRTQREFVRTLPRYARQTLDGYVAGINRHFREVGVDGLAEGPEGCRGAVWAREITLLDLAKMYRKLTFRAGTEALAGVMIDADAPMASTAALDPALREPLSAPLDVRPEAYARLGLTDPSEMGSNAVAYGADVTDNGRGLLLGNPHFPWSGIERWYQSHITIRGEYDVAGASLHGVPVINIGFNGHVAWSHTVSATRRFVFYELTLDPNDPLRYLVDGESREIEQIPVTAEALLPDGSVETRSETIYMTEYGPVINGASLSALAGGWPISLTGTILAVTDINLENTGLVEAWVEMGRARNMDEFEDALRAVTIPWVNTVAADRDGQAYFGDATRTPGVTAELRERCASRNFGNILYSAAAIMALDGSRAECELITVDRAAEGVLPYDQLPTLRTTEYAANANDTYWIANPRQPFEGFTPALGPTDYEQRVRTRQMFLEADARINGTDGRGPGGINIEQLKDMMFDSGSYAATLTLGGFTTACEGVADWNAYGANTAQYAEACGLLGSWDGRFRGESVGGHIFYESFVRFADDFGITGVIGAGVSDDYWLVPFDANDPVHTPRDLDLANPVLIEALRTALAAGVDRLVTASLPMNAPWEDLQFRIVGDERIPIHGMDGKLGFSAMGSTLVDGVGYIPTGGNSYMQVVTWDDSECPEAYALLSYSQSSDPASPFYADQTRAYSEGTWPEFPFCDAEVRAAQVTREVLVGP